MEKKKSGWKEERGKKGAAPFASIEDLSDESPPGEERSRLEVPGAREGGPPRIDISRASSSSHHEDSSPERELFAGEGGGTVKVGLGFTEDMALELRSSTEELDFHEPEPERKPRRKKLQHQQQAVVVTKYELETESEKENRERKDSGCSEGGLLFIGGRTSRLSSIGSAASGGSGVSGGSAVSHLSAASNYSRASRCSSPHRMLLETSFCGPKPIPTLSLEAEYPPSESVEAALLKRKADPAGAILPNCLEVKDAKPRRCSSERTVRPQTNPAVRSSSARAPKKPAIKQNDNELFRIIPLHGSIDEPEDDDTESNPLPDDDDFNPENGIYIPLKGPIIDTRKTEEPKSRKSEDPKKKKPEFEESDLVRFISLHGDDDEEIQNRRNNQSVQFKPWAESKQHLKDWPDWPKPRSPEPPKPGRLELQKKKNGRSLGQIPRDESRTPSPASSFSKGNIFRRSSDSSGSSKKSLSSGDSKTKKDTRNKSMFTSLFRKNVKETPVQKPQHEKASIDPKLTNVEYKFRQEEHVIDKDTIIIPLHSPDEIVEPLIRYEPGKEENDLSREPPSVKAERKPETVERKLDKPVKKSEKENVPENQRSSLEVHTVEKNVVVVDVINEDTKDQSRRPEPRTPIESKKVAKEPKRRVDELEVYDYEPRVRRSSSICSRETDMVSSRVEKPPEKDKPEKEPEKEKQEMKTEEVQKEKGATKVEKVEALKPEQEEEEIERDFKNDEIFETLSKSESGGTERQASQETVIENHLAREEDNVDRRTDKSPIRDDILSSVIHDEEAESLIKKDEDSENNITKSEGLERRSSESEVELEKESEPEECDEERKVLFHQTDSVDDELPYVPTTLPQERSVAVPIIPVRQRVGEVIKTCPVDRPRSTTPIQPANLEEYAAFHEPRPVSQEKMQITLPRSESVGKGRGRGKTSSPPPPLPPRAPQWVAFDEPERRRPPRRITTLPYTYVNPEECTCECHEAQHRLTDSQCSKAEQCSYTKKGGRTEKEKRFRT